MDIDDTGFWTMSGTLLIEITNPDDNPNNWIKNYYDLILSHGLVIHFDSFIQQYF